MLLAPLLLASAALAQHPGHGHGHAHPAALGPYPAAREASGTSWGPDAAPHEGAAFSALGWTGMAHGYVNGVYDRQGGPRGRSKAFSQSMGMAAAGRPAGPGRLTLRAMLSLEPAMGKGGYPLLLQTGETADGRAPLVDRQHPHDLLMELAAAYSVPLGDDASAFLYIGLPGEPALGPPAFMHRFSAAENPEAPLSHHWLDSTHITYGVATAGWTWRGLKLEASGFRGREPDQRRWDVEQPRLDSVAVRAALNPAPPWSLQASFGALRGPEQLAPDEDVKRWTASVAHHAAAGPGQWQTLAAWGRNQEEHAVPEDALLLESALALRRGPTVFGRAERVEKDDLAPGTFAVGRLSLGAVLDLARRGAARLGLGAVGSVHLVPRALRAAYGPRPLSFMVFARLRV